MIKVTQERANIYTIQLDVPDVHVLREMAIGYGIPLSQMIGSCYNKGVACHVDIIHEIAAHETRKRDNHGQNDNAG